MASRVLFAAALALVPQGPLAAREEPPVSEPRESPAPAPESLPPPATEPAAASTPASPSRTTRLQGAAQLDRNRPVAGATVLVAPDPGQGTMYATSTDAKGTFRIEGVPAGSYRVEFRRVGLGTVRKEGVVLKPPFRGVVEVTMVPSSSLPSAGALPSPAPGQSEATPEGRGGDAREFSLSGTAVDVDGKPLSDVRIRITRADGSADPIQGLTGADGSYRIDGLTEGEWELESLGLAYLPLRVSLLLSADAQLRLVLVRQPTIYEPPPLDLMPAEEPIPPPAS